MTHNPPRIAVVYANFYKEEMATMLAYTLECLAEQGITEESVETYDVLGSFEIPLVASKLAESGQVDAIITLGIIVEGQTHHARLIAEECARGCMDVQLNHGVPCAFEVLYVDSLALAKERLTKGGEAVAAVMHCLAQLNRL